MGGSFPGSWRGFNFFHFTTHIFPYIEKGFNSYQVAGILRTYCSPWLCLSAEWLCWKDDYLPEPNTSRAAAIIVCCKTIVNMCRVNRSVRGLFGGGAELGKLPVVLVFGTYFFGNWIRFFAERSAFIWFNWIKTISFIREVFLGVSFRRCNVRPTFCRKA